MATGSAASMDVAEEIVELWWCPVCDGAAHRTRRPGRPKLYCSNACRQRAYRWRRDHHARTVAPRGHPAASALVPFGRWHALRTSRDFMSGLRDRRSRQPTVCGVLARPSRLLGRRSHHQFVAVSPDACQTCVRLIAPPVDPLTTIAVTAAPEGSWRARSGHDPIAWIERLDPQHPIRRHPERYGQLTQAWRERNLARRHR